jgi:hypothetical protein
VNTTHSAHIIVSVLLALGSTPATTGELYKYRMPDDTVLYTDEVSTRGVVEEVIQEAPPDPARIEAERAAKLKSEAARTDRLALQREAKLSEINVHIREATRALKAAKEAFTVGLEPRPGERLGVVGGHTRLSDAYWSRIGELRRATEGAREHLYAAYIARDALR